MNDEQPKRTQPISSVSAERPSTADRVRQIQELQRQMELQPSPLAVSAAGTVAQVGSAPEIPTAFDVGGVRRVPTNFASRAVATSQAVYAKAQANEAALFGGRSVPMGAVGNPWKVIDFTPYIPAVFNPPAPLSSYSVRVPEQALQTALGQLFEVSLEPLAELSRELQAQTRAVVTDDSGSLAGAECGSLADLEALFERAPDLLESVVTRAFGYDATDVQLSRMQEAQHGGFLVELTRGDETRSVLVNNFGMPVPEGMDPFGAQIRMDYYRDFFG